MVSLTFCAVVNVIRKFLSFFFLVLLGNFLMPKLIANSVIFCALGSQSQEKSVRTALYKLGPKPTTQQHFLHLCISIYGIYLYKLRLGWTPT